MECEECIFYGFAAGLILMASLHGLLLAAILLFSKRLQSKANKFLALSLLGTCVILGYEFAAYLDLEDYIPNVIQYMPIYLDTIIAVGIFYFVLFLIQPKRQLTQFEKLGFIALGLDIFLNLLYIPVGLFLENEDTILRMDDYIEATANVLGIVTAVILLPTALIRVNNYQKFLYNNYSTTQYKSLGWLRNYLVLVIGLLCVAIIGFFQYWFGTEEDFEFTYALYTLGQIILLFSVGYFVILQYQWFQIVPYTGAQEETPESLTKLSSKTDIYHESLMALLHEEKVYEDTELTLERLAERLQISSGYLSQIINKKEQKNFFEFVNFYRVEAVKEKLLDTDFRNYTIMGIALESGFKSKSTFNSVFKKFTGHTPSAYKRIHDLAEAQIH